VSKKDSTATHFTIKLLRVNRSKQNLQKQTAKKYGNNPVNFRQKSLQIDGIINGQMFRTESHYFQYCTHFNAKIMSYHRCLDVSCISKLTALSRN